MNNETKVRALLASGKSSEDIVKFLVMNDDYRTGPEARTALETFMNGAGLVPHKKVPMSELYLAWYEALPRADKLAQTKESLHTQAVAIGMSVKSADWYARMYLLAGKLALKMSAVDDIPFELTVNAHDMPSESYIDDRGKEHWYADEVPATTLEDYLAELHDAEYEALSITKRKKFDKDATARYHGGVL
jgi:hypothetical protein